MMKKRKILFINWRDIKNPEAGGCEVYSHEIFKRLARQGTYDITMLSHAFPGGALEEDIDGIHVIRRGNLLLFNYAVVPFLMKHQKEYDLVFEDLAKVPFFTPLYVSQPRLHLVHHFFGTSVFKECSPPIAAYVYAMEKLIPRVYSRDRFVAVSQSTRAEILTFCKDSSKVDVVEGGVDVDFFYPTHPKDPRPTLVHVGRIKKYKNVQFVIHCLKEIKSLLPETTLQIAGTGDYLNALIDLTHQLGLDDSVSFLGYVSEEHKRDILSRATLFVYPSIKEGWGLGNTEANLCGTISLSSNVPGLRDSVIDGETGLLFEYNNKKDFVEKALFLLQNSQTRKEMESNALAFAKAFSWDGAAVRMKSVIDDVI